MVCGITFYAVSVEVMVKYKFFREYLATFKKTVAMHEVFLQRIAAHPALRGDMNFEVFLSYDQDVSYLTVTALSMNQYTIERISSK